MRMWQVFAIGAAGVAAVMMGVAHADEAEEKTGLAVGDEAPDFELVLDADIAARYLDPDAADDAVLKLSGLRGEVNVLLAFYPKAFTGGCTAQLCGYRDDIEEFKAADTEIIAISMDEQEESSAFRAEYEMPFPVMGDEDGSVVEAYGVPVRERQDMKFPSRSVFLIDKEGVIRYIDMEYDIEGGIEPLYQALNDIKEMEAGETG